MDLTDVITAKAAPFMDVKVFLCHFTGWFHFLFSCLMHVCIKRFGFVFQGCNQGVKVCSRFGFRDDSRRKGIVDPLRYRGGWSEGGDTEESQPTAAAE